MSERYAMGFRLARSQPPPEDLALDWLLRWLAHGLLLLLPITTLLQDYIPDLAAWALLWGLPFALALATFGNPLFRSEEAEDDEPTVGAEL